MSDQQETLLELQRLLQRRDVNRAYERDLLDERKMVINKLAQQNYRSRQSRQRFIEQSFIPRVRQEVTRTTDRRRRTAVDRLAITPTNIISTPNNSRYPLRNRN